MKLVANRINQTHLREILPAISEDIQIDGVLAAVACGRISSDEAQGLLEDALVGRVDDLVRVLH